MLSLQLRNHTKDAALFNVHNFMTYLKLSSDSNYPIQVPDTVGPVGALP